MRDLSGQLIKGYELLERIGAGGFGAVYKANQSTVGREVAVKVILPGHANNSDFIRSFEIEAQLIARLEHLHIVPLYDFWRDPSGAYLVMRWMRGGSLRDVLNTGPLELNHVALNLEQLAAGLATAHSQNIIHRDLKPSNILLDLEGNSYLADFGIAKDNKNSNGVSPQSRIALGSPEYMAPEQVQGGPITPQTDIYSLGITLYQSITGQHPFHRGNTVEILYKQINDPLPRIETLEPDICDGVNQVLQKATAKNPKRRYQDVLEFAHTFREAANLDHVLQDIALSEPLTVREGEILRLIVEGYSNKQIAQTLFVELSTVKWHITQLYRKLHVRSRAQAIVRARELDLIVLAGDDAGEETGVTGGVSIVSPEPINPYKGLRPFDSADNRDFFGREAMIEHLLARMTEMSVMARFLAVIGPSGSGKSSLINAGLIPALWSGDLPGSERWFIVKMSPGSHPLDELEVALTRIAADQGNNMYEHLHRDGFGLLRVANLILPQDDSNLLLVIDQFEELYTLVQDELVRSHFLDLLYTAVTDPRGRVRIIISLRADFYDQPLLHPNFGDLIRSRMETVLPLSAAELERAILKPAEGVGVYYESGLVASIIEDVLYQPGGLPLLQYALTELFEERSGRILTKNAYELIGGAVGALAKRAEEIYREHDQNGRRLIRQMFLRLVQIGDGQSDRGRLADTRRRVTRSELLAIASDPEQMDEIIDTFGAYRLLSMDHDQSSRQATVEIAHEALLNEWQRLRAWLDESREDLLQHRRLSILYTEWHQENCDPGYLVKDARLDQLVNWATSSDLALTPGEQAFLDASLSSHEKKVAAEEARRQRELETAHKLAETEARRATEQTQANRRLRWLALGLAFLLVIAVGAAFLAFQQTRRAERQARLETAQELASAAQSNLDIDPELSILLALQAVDTTYTVDNTVIQQAEAVLHQAISKSHVIFTLRGTKVAPTNWVHDVAFSPDGSQLVTTHCMENTAIIWNAVTGEKLLTLDHGDGFPGVFGVAFNPDGTRLATASGGTPGVAIIWDATTGQELLTLSGHTSWINRLDFSPDGTVLATTSADMTVKLWDVKTGQDLLTLDEHNGASNDVAFSPDGKRLATTDDRSAYIWDATTGEKLLTLNGHTAPVWGTAINHDGTLLATASADGTAKVWDIASGLLLLNLTGHNDGVRDVAFSQAGKMLATASLDGTAKVWDLETGKELLTLTGHTDQVLSVDFSPDGRRLVTSSIDQTARVWDVIPDHELFAFPTGTAYVVALSPDGKYLATTSARGTATIWELATGKPIRTVSDQGFAKPQNEVEFTGDGVRLVPGVSFSPDGVHLALAGSDNTAKIWDVNTGLVQVTLRGHTDAVNHLAFSPDGSLLATASEDKTARIWDAATGEELRTLSGHTEWVRYIAFSPDGTWLVTTSTNGIAIVWETATGRALSTLTGHTDKVTFAAFSPNGDFLATAGGDGMVKIWDTATWEEINTLSGHTNAINSVVYSLNSQHLVTASADGTSRIWEASSGKELLTITSNPIGVGYATFNQDGTRLITSDWDNTIRFYILPIEDLIALARERVTRSLTEDECQRYLHTDECPSM
jgi:WD40 repeat protein/serine/threonine protein kinase